MKNRLLSNRRTHIDSSLKTFHPVRNGFITPHTGQTATEEGVWPRSLGGRASSKSLTWDECDLSGEHMLCSQRPRGGHASHSCAFKPGLLTHKTHHTVSVQQPVSANLRHSRITHLRQTLTAPPFPTSLSCSQSFQPDILVFTSISHLSFTTEPSLNCF